MFHSRLSDILTNADYSWLHKLGVWLISWVTWIVPAAQQTFDSCVAPDYQLGVSTIFITTLALIFVLPVMTLWMSGVTWWQVALYTLGVYLFMGFLFQLFRRTRPGM